jgi:zinc/manganese transport system substrate-binding protein
MVLTSFKEQTMRRYLITLLTLLACCQTASAVTTGLNIFACEPEWASLLGELGGSHVHITTALTAQQDPHHLQAKPSLIASIRDANMVVCSGAELEVGWLPLLLRRSGNNAIQPGQPGYVMTAMLVRRLDIPHRLDRAQGDVHPEGNPHVHLNPVNIKRIAKNLGEKLQQLDPTNSADYAANTQDFLARWSAASERWDELIAPLTGTRVIVNHTSFTYLTDFLGLSVVADLEPKPGLPPSSAHLASLLEQFSNNPPAAILYTPYADSRPVMWLAERLHIPAIELPYTVGGQDTNNLFGLMDKTISLLLTNQAAAE